MKPKLFVGSSREAVQVANAIHENLTHDAEVTVWNQGIFDLSQSALESLLTKLDQMEFGIFVFAPDDIVQIRDEENSSTRDNVIFELGLFVGRLGRERSFFFLPSEHGGFRVPTDLIGTTPGIYESGRSDGNLVAATAVACNAVRRSMEQLAPTLGSSTANNAPQPEEPRAEDKEKSDKAQSDKEPAKNRGQAFDWMEAYFAEDYKKAITLLEKLVETTKKEDEKYSYMLYLGDAKAKVDFTDGTAYLRARVDERPKDGSGYLWLASTYTEADRYDEAISLLDEGVKHATETHQLLHRKATLLAETGDREEAEAIWRKLMEDVPTYRAPYTSLARVLVDEGDEDEAMEVYETGLSQMPNDTGLLVDYGRYLLNQTEHEAAVSILARLTSIKPDDSTSLTLLGNAYLGCSFDGLALEAYQRANEIAKGKEAWILANIGNLYNNNELYPQAVSFLKQAQDLESDSVYTHKRLAQALESNEEQRKNADKLIQEQKRRPRKSAPDEPT